MGKNHISGMVLRIRPKFWWMLAMGVRHNHTKYEFETHGWRSATGVTCGPPFQNLWKMAQKVAWLEHHPFSKLPASSGGLLHTLKRIPTFMATAMLFLADSVLCGFYV